jgi:GNAT superfamily N-acetyltransferase
VEVRLALAHEEDEVLSLARQNAAVVSPHVTWNQAVASATFRRYLTAADPTFFVAVDDGKIVGFLTASIHGFTFASGIFTIQDVIYVSPDRRGTRAAARLLKAFDQWSEELGAVEIHYGTSTGFKPDRFAKFVERHSGAETVGCLLRRVRKT